MRVNALGGSMPTCAPQLFSDKDGDVTGAARPMDY